MKQGLPSTPSTALSFEKSRPLGHLRSGQPQSPLLCAHQRGPTPRNRPERTSTMAQHGDQTLFPRETPVRHWRQGSSRRQSHLFPPHDLPAPSLWWIGGRAMPALDLQRANHQTMSASPFLRASWQRTSQPLAAPALRRFREPHRRRGFKRSSWYVENHRGKFHAEEYKGAAINFPSKPAKRDQTSSNAPGAKANRALQEAPRRLDHILDVPVRLHAEHIEHMVAHRKEIIGRSQAIGPQLNLYHFLHLAWVRR